MKHVDDIKALVRTLQQSTKFHALIIQSPPGWGKSSTVEGVLKDLNVSFHALGSYSTPLFLYNALCESPDRTLVIDDCAGLFEDATTMAILKAATWASAGTNGERRVSWSSTSEKAKHPSVEFRGKIILLANNLPVGRNTEAFLSRTLCLRLEFDNFETAEMLMKASQSDAYDDAMLSHCVASYLVDRLAGCNSDKINLRTLQLAYEVALSNPNDWKALLDMLLPEISPRVLADNLSATGATSEAQVREFIRETGLSRRTFFYYRKKQKNLMGLGPETPGQTRELDDNRYQTYSASQETGRTTQEA